MRAAFLIFIAVIALSFQEPQKLALVSEAQSYFICVSASAEVYHDTRDCSGLKKCTHDIAEVSKEDAEQKFVRRPCKVCMK
jgi:hypothetical protein